MGLRFPNANILSFYLQRASPPVTTSSAGNQALFSGHGNSVRQVTVSVLPGRSCFRHAYVVREAQVPESDLVKADCLNYLKHRLAEAHYSAYDWSGVVAALAASVKGEQTSCVSIKKSSKGPACPMSGAPNRVKIDRHMTILWSGGFITLTDTACIC